MDLKILAIIIGSSYSLFTVVSLFILILHDDDFLFILSVAMTPAVFILIIFPTFFVNSVEQQTELENTTTYLLAPISEGNDDTANKYVIRDKEQTSFLAILKDGMYEIIHADNDQVSFRDTDNVPSVLVRECSITERRHYCFIFYTDHTTHCTSYELLTPKDAISYRIQ